MEHLPLALSITTSIVFFASFWWFDSEIKQLKRQVDELKTSTTTFDKSFFEKGADQVFPGSPPEDTIVVDEELRKRFTKKRVTEKTTTTETRND
jgi:hypothetical protein